MQRKANMKSRSGGRRPGRIDATFEAPMYKGPVKISGSELATNTVKFNATFNVAATTNVSGVIDTVLGNSPASLTDWASLAATFHEYRVLAMELEYVPVKNVATWAYGVHHLVVDHESNAALGSIAAACEHDSLSVHSGYSGYKKIARAAGTEEIGFVPTSSPVSYYYLKCYTSGNTPSITLGQFYLTYRLEFRGKK